MKTPDEVARLLITEGKGWHDEDGPTVVDGIDGEDGAGYPVRYHWESGGAGADSAAGFIDNNYLPVGEACRVVAAAFAKRTELARAFLQDQLDACSGSADGEPCEICARARAALESLEGR